MRTVRTVRPLFVLQARRAEQAKHARGTRQKLVAYAAMRRALHGGGAGMAAGCGATPLRGLQQPLLVSGGE